MKKTFTIQVTVERGPKRGEPYKVVSVIVDGKRKGRQVGRLDANEAWWVVAHNESSAVTVEESQF